MARNDWYTVYDDGFVYKVQKIDPEDRTPVTATDDGRTKTSYRITRFHGRMHHCDCMARTSWCRHKAIVTFFLEEGKVNQRWLYNFDQRMWLPSYQQEG